MPVCRAGRGTASPPPATTHRPRRYPSDTTDAEWALLESLLPPPASGQGRGRPEAHHRRDIVDAIRWCLGEQSAKHLRGDAMEAVVFNGNEKLSPLGI